MEIRSAVAFVLGLAATTAQAQSTPSAAPAPAAPAPAAAAPAAAPHVYGRLEHAQITGGPPIEVEAQLDGGGNITVLQAVEIKYAHGEGGMYAHFVVDNGRVVSGRTVNLALPVLQDQHLHDRNGAIDHRPIVTMSFCIGDHAFTTNVALQVRENYNPPLQLSKADAAQFGAVDPQKKNTIEPDCAAPAAPAPK